MTEAIADLFWRHAPVHHSSNRTPSFYVLESRTGSPLETSSASPPSLPQQNYVRLRLWSINDRPMTAFLGTKLTAFYSSHLARSAFRRFRYFFGRRATFRTSDSLDSLSSELRAVPKFVDSHPKEPHSVELSICYPPVHWIGSLFLSSKNPFRCLLASPLI